MRSIMKQVVLLTVLMGGMAYGAPEPAKRVIIVPIDGVVDLGMAPFVERAIREAEATHADAILLDINTLGGRVDAALLIRDALLESRVDTIAYIHPRAISAGAFISLACKTIVMQPGGSIGAATPVIEDGGEMKAADEKMVSYFRTEMGATAERNGRPREVAEAMVDREIEIEGLIAAGKLLTLTTSDAVRLGVADFEAESIDEVLEELGLADAVRVAHVINWAERFARIVSHPALSSLLMSLGFLGIMIELYRPGWGIPGTIGLTCLILFFLGHYVVHLAGWEELILFGVGVLLLALEVFVLPGFGVAGVAGIVAMLASVFLALLGSDLRVSWEFGYMTDALTVVASGMIGVLVGGVLLVRFVPSSRAGSLFILRRKLKASEGFVTHATAVQEQFPIGSRGVAMADLRPAGVVRMDGGRIDAVSEGSYISRGTDVTIVSWNTGHAVVRAVDNDKEAEVQP